MCLSLSCSPLFVVVVVVVVVVIVVFVVVAALCWGLCVFILL